MARDEREDQGKGKGRRQEIGGAGLHGGWTAAKRRGWRWRPEVEGGDGRAKKGWRWGLKSPPHFAPTQDRPVAVLRRPRK